MARFQHIPSLSKALDLGRVSSSGELRPLDVSNVFCALLYRHIFRNKGSMVMREGAFSVPSIMPSLSELYCFYVALHFPDSKGLAEYTVTVWGDFTMGELEKGAKDAPIRHGFVKQPHFILARTAKVLDKVIAKDVTSEAFLAHKPRGCFL